MTTIRFSFPTRSDAWAAMRAFDAAGMPAGWPTGDGERALLVQAPSVERAADVGFGCGAYGYARIGGAL